jgi:hypothetical protein
MAGAPYASPMSPIAATQITAVATAILAVFAIVTAVGMLSPAACEHALAGGQVA